jgi:hypothetical protein
MASHHRILNITNGFYLKPTQVYRGIENCAFAWVEVGITCRNLTIEESLASLNEQAKIREPLVYAEIPGIVFDGPLPIRNDLIRAAHEFVTSV